MDSLPPLEKGSPTKSHGRGHSRVVSASRTPLARRLTKGPLDVDDPLAAEAEPPPSTLGTANHEAADTPIPATPFSPERPSVELTAAHPPPPAPPAKDFGYLLRPEIYHPLSQLDIPPPFRGPNFQPPPSKPLPDLLSNHNIRSAATAAALRLCSPPAPPPAELFSLIYTRLACLTLINHLPFAAEESKALQDINSPFYKDETTGKNVLPWELRVLVVRLQGIGYGDARRGISGYYDLAKQARAEIKNSKDSDEKRQMWRERLQDLGICVANALIELGDMGAATRHLEGLRRRDDKQDSSLDGRLALLYIHLGDIDAARRLFTPDKSDDYLKPLTSMAEGRYSDALEEWKALPPSDLTAQNLAVCLFYAGKVEETMELLEGLVEKGRGFHALTFNLATVYELCSERGREKKGELVRRVARGIEEKGGGGRGMVDFKL